VSLAVDPAVGRVRVGVKIRVDPVVVVLGERLLLLRTYY
tara:strand:+ start:224 stop:340 length:117 start_codon:yes stop_codon:yes gene_type:complete